MNHKVSITVNYKILGGSTGSFTRIVKADISELKAQSDNVGGGRQEDQIDGEIKVGNLNGDYDALAVYINDKATYYVHEDDYEYELYINGELYNTNKLKLIDIDEDGKIFIFKAYDISINRYTNIFTDWETEYNVVKNVTPVTEDIYYTDPRTIGIVNTSDLQSFASGDDIAVVNYLNTKIPSYNTQLPVIFNFTFSGLTTYNISITNNRLEAFGVYDGIERHTPAGTDWVYNTDVSGKPQFIKKPATGIVTYSRFIGATNISPCTVTSERDAGATINYQGVGFLLKDVIEYLIGEADSSIIFDANSFLGLDNVVGENFVNVTVDDPTKCFKHLILMTTSDFIPTLRGNQRNNLAEDGFINFRKIDELLNDLSLYWYLEESGGNHYFRLEHITTKSLGTSNPSLQEYAYQSEKINIEEDKYDRMTNSTNSSTYEFKKSTFIFREGSKSIDFGNDRIHLDIDYVRDVGDDVFFSSEANEWVLLACSKETASPNDYYVRYVNDPGGIRPSILVNNLELSFDWLTRNLIEVPGRFDINGNEYAANRRQKKYTVELEIKLGNLQTEFALYDSIDYRGNAAEIQRLQKSRITNTIGKIKIKYVP
jgi:hypothetical protein